MGIRYTVPEPDVENFKDWDDDPIFKFRDQGNNLTYLVRRVQEPLVIALDADWGTGKTIFLKRWRHLNNKELEDVAGEGGQDAMPEGNDGGGVSAFKTIYFDAFAHDYFDDPFAALMGELLDQLGCASKDKIAKVAGLIVESGVRVGIKTLGLGDAAADEVCDFLKTHKTRKKEIKDFKETLKTTAKDNRRIVIIIDELDRCKPDFALNLLEYIKHLFNVDNVHFILGMNSKALEEMVKTRYGAAIDASRYLDKFITVKMGHRPAEFKEEHSSYQYFQKKYKEMGLSGSSLEFVIGSALIEGNKPPLRDVNQLLTNLALMPFGSRGNLSLYSEDALLHCRIFITFLICLRWLDRSLFDQIRHFEKYIHDSDEAQRIANLMQKKVTVIDHEIFRDGVCRSIDCFLNIYNYVALHQENPPLDDHYDSGVYRRLDKNVFSYVDSIQLHTD